MIVVLGRFREQITPVEAHLDQQELLELQTGWVAFWRKIGEIFFNFERSGRGYGWAQTPFARNQATGFAGQ